jgi:archaetidylinositol phosphate synthase
MSTKTFTDAKRVQESLLAPLEKRVLLWMAARMPRRINADHLTGLGLLSMALAGVFYYFSQNNLAWLHLVNLALALNWFGDSLDGTLARFRDMQRPRYGFYVDHMVDAFSTVFLLGGLAISGYMSANVAYGILLIYLVLAINVYLATYTLGEFTISFGMVSPTEGRILLGIWNCVLLYLPEITVGGTTFLLTDIAGILVIVILGYILISSVVKNTHTLYRMEPLRRIKH